MASNYLHVYKTMRMDYTSIYETSPHELRFMVMHCLSCTVCIYHRSTVHYDLKCQSAEFCWFCKDCCDNCMKTAGVGLTAKSTDSSTQMRFCSNECSVLSPNVHVTPSIDFWDITQNPPAPSSRTCALFDNHQELLYIISECTMKQGYHSFDITLCRGNGSEPFVADKVYAVCYCRQPTTQLFFEFFMTEDLQVQEMIILSGNLAKHQQFEISANSVLHMIIKQALLHKGICNISTLLKVYGKKGKTAAH